jgi:hypothetical protein
VPATLWVIYPHFVSTFIRFPYFIRKTNPLPVWARHACSSQGSSTSANPLQKTVIGPSTVNTMRYRGKFLQEQVGAQMKLAACVRFEFLLAMDLT